jgi:hypothetical protein
MADGNREETVVIRLGTHDAVRKLNNSNFTCEFAERTSLTTGLTGLAVEAVGFPNVFPNVRPHPDDPTDQLTLEIVTGGGPAVIETTTAPKGYWSDSELVAWLADNLARFPSLPMDTVLDGTGPVPGNPLQSTWTFELTSATDPLLAFAISADKTTSGLGRMLGFTNPSAPAPSQTAPSPPAFTGDSVVYLHSPRVAPGGLDGDGSKVQQLIAIPITVPYGLFQTFAPDPAAQRVIDWTGRKEVGSVLHEITIEMRDQYGIPLDIGDNQEMFVSLRFFRKQ